MGTQALEMRRKTPLLDTQQWSIGPKNCLNGGMVDSVKRTRHAIRRRTGRTPLPLIVVNINQREDGALQHHVHQSHPPRRHSHYAVQVTLRPTCGYGHYMIAFVTPHRLVLFDSANSKDCVLERPTSLLAQIFRQHGVSHPLEVLHLPRTSVCDNRCSIWIALAYYLVSVYSLRRLVEVVRAGRTTREDTLRSFHADVLQSRHTTASVPTTGKMTPAPTMQPHRKRGVSKKMCGYKKSHKHTQCKSSSKPSRGRRSRLRSSPVTASRMSKPRYATSKAPR